MSVNRRRKPGGSRTADIMRVVSAFVLTVAAVLLVGAVIYFIRSETKSLFEVKETETKRSTTEAASEPGSEEITIETEKLKPGFNELSEGKVVYVTDGSGSLFKEGWLDDGGKLYYFDENGIMNRDPLSENAMTYTFGINGNVIAIRYTPGTVNEEIAAKEYPFVSKTGDLWAYLNLKKQKGSFYAIMYKYTTQSMSHQLGGTVKGQYTSPGSLQVDGEYIYYLPMTAEPEGADKSTNGNLYRMRPQDSRREIVAENVDGYKVLNGFVYYCSQGTVIKTDTAAEDTSEIVFTADLEYKVDITDTRKAFLILSDGTPVTMESEDFRTGDFRYALSGEGEILSVHPQTSVTVSDYVYSVESDLFFGTRMSRIVRTDKNGVTETISSEFPGAVENMHSDEGTIYAEYKDSAGLAGILLITLDGDVDLIAGDTDGSLVIYGFDGDRIIVKKNSASSSGFTTVRKTEGVPLTLGIVPVIVDSPEAAEYESSLDVGNVSVQAGPGSEKSPELKGPGSENRTELKGPGDDPEKETVMPSTRIVNGPGGEMTIGGGPGM